MWCTATVNFNEKSCGEKFPKVFIGKDCWDYDEFDLEKKQCSRCSSNLFEVKVSKGLACRHPGRRYLNVGYEKYTFDTEYKFSNFLCNIGGEPTCEPHPYSFGGKNTIWYQT